MPGKPFYITTAIAYPNGPPHIGQGHEATAAAIARFQRLEGREDCSICRQRPWPRAHFHSP
jgi:methionyl-tRNA synthetase